MLHHCCRYVSHPAMVNKQLLLALIPNSIFEYSNMMTSVDQGETTADPCPSVWVDAMTMYLSTKLRDDKIHAEEIASDFNGTLQNTTNIHKLLVAMLFTSYLQVILILILKINVSHQVECVLLACLEHLPDDNYVLYLLASSFHLYTTGSHGSTPVSSYLKQMNLLGKITNTAVVPRSVGQSLSSSLLFSYNL